MNTFKKLGYVSAVVTIALAIAPRMLTASSEQTPWRNLSLAQLSAVWWEWAFSIPISSSPFIDPTGVNAYSGQPYANSGLLFLAGTFTVNQEQNGNLTATVTRSISVKQGTALFFPLINSEVDNTCGTPHSGGNCLGYQNSLM